MASVEYSIKQRYCKRNRISGDVFSFIKTDSSASFKAVLCDGMGHGIKANILANLTLPLIANTDFNKDSLKELTKNILEIQPTCAIRKMNHCTYTLASYDDTKHELFIINYDNPQPLIFFDGEIAKNISWQSVENPFYGKRPRNITFTTIHLLQEISVLMCSDGVTQSGVGNIFPFGWGLRRVSSFVMPFFAEKLLPHEIATKVVAKAIEYEKDYTHDDVSCCVITIKK